MRTDDRYKHLLRYMTPALVDRIFASMPIIEERHDAAISNDSPRHITLFGGEPLLAHSRPLISHIINTAREHGPTVFSAVSNATELEAYEDYLGPDLISTLQITIDGPPSKHDARRIYEDGTGSFEKISSNIDLALSKDVSVDVRMNIDRTNIDDLPELARYYIARGWASHPRFSTYVAPVHATNDKTDKQTTFNSWELKAALRGLQFHHEEAMIIGMNDDALRTMVGRVFHEKGDALPLMKTSFCSAHTNMYIFDALGDIYACWERTGDKNLRVGWLEDDGKAEFVADRLANWRARNVSSNTTCEQCRYAMYCGGGCAVLAEDLHGSIHGNYCDAFGRRFRVTVAEAFDDHVSGRIAVDPGVQALRAL